VSRPNSIPCAFCGKTVRITGKIQDANLYIIATKTRDRPRAAWHLDGCVENDPLTKDLREADWLVVFAEIVKRDPARVVRREARK